MCPTCKQDYTGRVQLGMARAHWKLVCERPVEDDERLMAADDLAMALKDSDDYEAALPLHEEGRVVDAHTELEVTSDDEEEPALEDPASREDADGGTATNGARKREVRVFTAEETLAEDVAALATLAMTLEANSVSVVQAVAVLPRVSAMLIRAYLDDILVGGPCARGDLLLSEFLSCQDRRIRRATSGVGDRCSFDARLERFFIGVRRAPAAGTARRWV